MAQIASVGRQPLVDEIRTIVNLFPVKDSPFESLQNTAELEASGRPLMNSTSGVFPQAFSEVLGHLYKLGVTAFASLRSVRHGSSIAFEYYNGWKDSFSESLYSVPIGSPTSISGSLTKTLYLLMRPENRRSFRASGRPRFPRGGIPDIWGYTTDKALYFERVFQGVGGVGPTVSIQQLPNWSHNINWTLALRRALPDDVDLPSHVTMFGTIFKYFDGMLEERDHNETLPLQI
ncbi:hypothetical protein EC968_008917 [Mortierella alpina]|nr:hypothetical protein EC968_008917 [Mortierella alpina]